MSATDQIVDNMEHVTAPETSAWSPLWTVVLGVAVAAALYEYWLRNSREFRLSKNIPAPPMLPLVGNGHLVFNLSNAGKFYNK